MALLSSARAILVAVVAPLLVLIAAAAGVTVVALELDGVLVARTIKADGQPRETHIWFVTDQDGWLLEAGQPTNPWILDLMRGSDLELKSDTGFHPFRYELQPNQGNRQIRTLMREKYGWRDAWVALLFDTTASFPVRVTPLEAAAPP